MILTWCEADPSGADASGKGAEFLGGRLAYASETAPRMMAKCCAGY